MLRIIAGRAKGVRLDTPDGERTRPTRAAVREAAFSLLAARLDFARLDVLDAFAGSGALGLEAWSRGATHVCCFDQDPRCVRLIALNAERCGAAADLTVRRARVPEVLQAGRGELARRDLVFLDPPYAAGLLNATLAALATHDWLALDAFVLVEHDAQQNGSPAQHADFELVTQKSYGITGITLLRYAPADAPTRSPS